MTRRVRWARWAQVWAAVVALTPVSVGAQNDPDAQVWAQVLAIGRLSDDWRAHVEVQPRWMNDTSELGLTIARVAVGRQITPRFSVWLGHAWVPRTLGAGTRHEQRLWQQLSVTAPTVGRWAPTARLRVEQRWLEPWAGPSHRVRLLARGQRPLGAATPWAIFAYDEVMVTLDRTPLGPARGFDRNRLAAGLSRRWSAAVSTDAGYLWEHAAVTEGRRNDHVLLGALNLSFSR